MKLELKHLTPYLPYELKLHYEHTNKTGQISNIYTIGEGYDNDDIKISIDGGSDEHIWMYKPILRPLSDLIKDIHGIGIPLFELLKIQYNEFTRAVLNEGYPWKFKEMNDGFYVMDINDTPYLSINKDLRVCEIWILEKLFEWHFDVFGLIEKGLGIDINTLD